ncbi:TPA_asm: hypothetical protein GJJ58_11055 [Listeria monocytogenes]|nr:hypothetical protein [Listeria monocytogenes]HAC2185664.1 hypothetical protein [Listeria monocytogenes]
MTGYIIKDAIEYRQLNILDQFLEGHNGFIAGGCFKNIFNNEKVKDVDVFFRNKRDYENAVDYYTNKEDNIIRKSYSNANVCAFYHRPSGIRIELVKSVFGEPEDVLDNFDFTITKVARYISDNEHKVALHPEFFEHLHLNKLVIDDKLIFPVSTFERMIRYIAYGYLPCLETKAKLVDAINSIQNIDENDFSKSLYEGLD